MSDLLNSASLVLIPSGYKEDIVYSAVPTDGSGDLSFTRASNGTRINSAGLVEVTPWNLCTYSEELNNSGWAATATITANTTANPINGATNADTIAGSGFIGQNLASIGVNTFSIYAKANSVAVIRLNIYDGANDRGADYNLTTGAITNGYGSPLALNSESVGNGWWRISITTNNANYSWAQIHRDSSGTCYLWGAQLNIGATAKPYFPTTDRLNVPRLTYQNGGGGCPSLLLEKQSTNQLTYSEQFDNVGWSKTGVTISANNTTSPDGTQNADKLVSINGATSCGILQYSLLSTSINYTYSTYVKKAGADWVQLIIITGVVARVWVNLTNGAIGTNNGNFSSVKVDAMGDGWYRISATFASTIIGTSIYIALADGDNIDAFTGNGTSGLFAWGAQLEPSSYPTSYIPTTSASATRVADACSKTGISSLIGQTEGVLFLDLERLGPSGEDPENLLFLSDTTLNNFVNIIYDVSTSRYKGQVRAGGTTSGIVTASQAYTGRIKIAIAYASNDLVMYINGVQQSTDTSVTIPSATFNSLGLGGYYNGTYGDTFRGLYSQAILFPTRLTNAELASLTTI